MGFERFQELEFEVANFLTDFFYDGRDFMDFMIIYLISGWFVWTKDTRDLGLIPNFGSLELILVFNRLC